MSIFVDAQYVPKLQPRLEMFKKRNDYSWNFRCPICGDSKKNSKKSRGYILKRDNSLYFYCHNCNTNMPFHKFLKFMDPNLYQEYQLESLNDWKEANPLPKKQFVSNLSKTEVDLPSIYNLEDSHVAKKYCLNRQIPKKFFSDIYYAADFKQFISEVEPNVEKGLKEQEGRIVFPLRSEKNILQGFQGRALYSSPVKYITIRLTGSEIKMFGLERVDPQKPIRVVEGPIDSFFVENCIASTDATLYNVPAKLKKDTSLDVQDADYIFIYDNEPRNSQINKNISKTIDLGYKVFIWPEEFKDFKDINEAVLAGYNPSVLNHFIDNNSFDGLKAKLEYTKWSK